jgi:excisionase family DNA binding protein
MGNDYQAPDGYLTFAQACAALGVSKMTLQRRVKAGELEAYEDPRDKRYRLVRVEDVERLGQPRKSAA